MKKTILILKFFILLFFLICGAILLLNIPLWLMSQHDTIENVIGYFMFGLIPALTITILYLKIKKLYKQLNSKQ